MSRRKRQKAIAARRHRTRWLSPRGCGGLRKYRLRTDVGQLDVNTKKNLFGEHSGFGGGVPSSPRKASAAVFLWASPQSLHGLYMEGDRRTRPVFPVKERRASREV